MTISKLAAFVFPPRLVLRYATVGASSALLEISLFYSFVTWLALPLMLANVSAVCITTVIAFMAQKRFTFRVRGRLTPQTVRYGLQQGINFLLNNALVFLFAQILQLRPLLAKTLQLGLCFVFNFCFSRFVVFRSRTVPVGNSKENVV
jgi:putative flippase GtrA